MTDSSIKVLVFHEDGILVAQCLDYDICVQGNNLDEIKRRMHLVINLEDQEEGGLGRIEPAPSELFELWDEAEGLSTSDNAHSLSLAMAPAMVTVPTMAWAV